AELAGDLEFLRFATRELGGGLPELEVTETDATQDVECAGEPRLAGKVLEGLIDREIQGLTNIDPSIAHLEHLRPVALSTTHFAGHQEVGQEIHLDRNPTCSLTCLTASASGVE